MSRHTLFLRLEGPLQAWGGHEAKFVIRRCAEAPTKSAIIGMLLAAKGIDRSKAVEENWLSELSQLSMGVRIDRPGVRWWDYHTVGADIGTHSAQGKVKRTAATGEIETFVSRREYLCDASFLVALQGDADLMEKLATALANPEWTPFLGRKSCPPSVPLLMRDKNPSEHDSLEAALRSLPWQPRMQGDKTPDSLHCILDWKPSENEPNAPPDAEIWYDIPLSFDPPSHAPRFIERIELAVGGQDGVPVAGVPLVSKTPSPPRPRADYRNSEYQTARQNRLAHDQYLCVFCKSPANTVQHITYRNAGGAEQQEDLRALCRLCHDAVTMIEYGEGMGMDRVDPKDPRWRKQIIDNRANIVEHRSREKKRRMMIKADPERAARFKDEEEDD
ncbi:MAG: type I-E CRISPR-associated protein Cas5/CasD [Ectothiorhodospiraceae bacterium]|nr:type I-E CRISPR-associated protein Cas5/CasD [Ectothiorhodospiraceae bacterium]